MQPMLNNFFSTIGWKSNLWDIFTAIPDGYCLINQFLDYIFSILLELNKCVIESENLLRICDISCAQIHFTLSENHDPKLATVERHYEDEWGKFGYCLSLFSL